MPRTKPVRLNLFSNESVAVHGARDLHKCIYLAATFFLGVGEKFPAF